MNGLHEALERIIQPILTHYVPNVQEAENGAVSFDIAEMRRQFGWNSERFPTCYAEDFLRTIEHLEESSDLESILRALGSVYECQKVFAAVEALTDAKEIHLPAVRLEANTPAELKAFRESVFERRWSEAIFEEYILPSEREDHAAYASLHLPPEKIEKRLQAILFSEIGDKVWTCDALQRVRKSGLEAIFSFVLTLDTQDHRVAVFERLDRALAIERAQVTDMEWGSLHHVLYGMCTGSQGYYVPLWYNPHSHFSFLIAAKYGLRLAARAS